MTSIAAQHTRISSPAQYQENDLAECFDQFDDMFDDDIDIGRISPAEYDAIVAELFAEGESAIGKVFARKHEDTVLDAVLAESFDMDSTYGSLIIAAENDCPFPAAWDTRVRMLSRSSLPSQQAQCNLKPSQETCRIRNSLEASTGCSKLKSPLFKTEIADPPDINEVLGQGKAFDELKHARMVKTRSEFTVAPLRHRTSTSKSANTIAEESSDSEAESLIKGQDQPSSHSVRLVQSQLEAQLRSAPEKQKKQTSSNTVRDSSTANDRPTSQNRIPAKTTTPSKMDAAIAVLQSSPRKKSGTDRGRKLFTVQIEAPDQCIHKYPVYEYDDPSSIAREIHVQFKHSIVFHDNWQQCISDLWEKKVQRLAEKDAARKQS